jgi:hypothetical protein
MNAIKLMTSAAALSLFAVACAGGHDESDSNSNASAAAASASSTIRPGTYLLASDGLSGTLTVQSASTQSVSYVLSVFHDDDSSYASLAGRTAAVRPGGFQDAIDRTCILFLSGGGGKVTLAVKGDCSMNAMQAFAKGAGTYTLGAAHCGLGTTYDAESARCAGSGGQNDPSDQ